MRNALVAEWIIARLTDRNRAVAIIGDLLESVGEEKTFAFWLSVTGIVLSLSWRPIAGFVAAFFCNYFLLTLSWHVYHPMGRISPAHDPSHIPFFNAFGLLIESLWIIAPYALVRYGFRERFAQLAVNHDTFLVLVDTVSRSRNFGNRRNHRDFFGWICAMAQAFVGRHVRNRIRMRWHPIRLPRNGIPGPDCALCCSRCGRGVVAIASDSRSYRRL